MTDNGTEVKTSRLSELIGLLEDHLELASLEWRYEKEQGVRRAVALGVIALLVAAAFVLLQVALVCAVVKAGLPLGWVCFGLALVYAAVAVGVLRTWARRDPRVGEPFQASREQLTENLKWIKTLFS